MRYINSIKGSLIAFAAFTVLAILIPGYGYSNQAELILTVAAFLFAILAGFFISRSSSRFSEMRTLIGGEDALMLSLYKISQIQGKEFAGKMANLIDKIYIVSYDHELYDYPYKQTHPYFMKMWDLVRKTNKKASKSYEKIIDILTDIEEHRDLADAVSKEKVGRGQWLILVILSVLVLFSLFYLKTAELYSTVITILLSTVLIVVLLINRDLQNFKFGEERSLLEESGQGVFESIGKLRYYNQRFFKKGYHSLPPDIKTFRLGLHKLGENPRIKIVENRKRKR